MKKRKRKYIGACDNYNLVGPGKHKLWGLPIVTESDYTKNGAQHLAFQGDFITDVSPYIHCDSIFIKYPLKM